MIVEERALGLKGRHPTFGQEPRACSFRDLDPNFKQLAVDAQRSPQRVGFLPYLVGPLPKIKLHQTVY